MPMCCFSMMFPKSTRQFLIKYLNAAFSKSQVNPVEPLTLFIPRNLFFSTNFNESFVITFEKTKFISGKNTSRNLSWENLCRVY